MGLFDAPLLEALGEARRILIAGAGGGFDVYSGLPLYLALRAQKKEVHLANLSFSRFDPSFGQRKSEVLVRVDADCLVEPGRYFPEVYLSRFLKEHGIPAPVWCLERTGVAPIAEAYRLLRRELDLDAVVLVDGGTDSLMRGDEAGLGTPQEDSASMVAVDALDVERSFLVCLGFGVDHYHGVPHADVLQAIQELSKKGAYLGAWSLTGAMDEGRMLLDAVTYVHDAQPRYPSIVCSSIAGALEGDFGDVHRTQRTRDSRLFINPLMSIYFGFRLREVVRRLMYADRIRQTVTYSELSLAIETFRSGFTPRPRNPIPL
jgi:hypothetical protein